MGKPTIRLAIFWYIGEGIRMSLMFGDHYLVVAKVRERLAASKQRSHRFHMESISDVRQIELHTAEPLVPGPSRLEVEIAIAKLKKYKSPGSDQIPAELIQAGGEILLSAIPKLISSVWNKKELPDQWKESIIVPVHRKN
jgi:hypothetical protein